MQAQHFPDWLPDSHSHSERGPALAQIRTHRLILSSGTQERNSPRRNSVLAAARVQVHSPLPFQLLGHWDGQEVLMALSVWNHPTPNRTEGDKTPQV